MPTSRAIRRPTWGGALVTGAPNAALAYATMALSQCGCSQAHACLEYTCLPTIGLVGLTHPSGALRAVKRPLLVMLVVHIEAQYLCDLCCIWMKALAHASVHKTHVQMQV